MEEIIEYDNRIFYFKSLKENIIRQNENIKFLLQSLDEADSEINLLKNMGEIDIDDKISFNMGIHLKCKLDNNDNMLLRIDSKLNSICKHNFIEDYVEAGVEKEMIKIKYCDICNITKYN